ncbi:MAG: zinc ABC transporter substrate-binding protein [Candidatus Calescibacterium sp.]|nr:zinc ABC transporter substrate-binding protein [Candidatus Calescibacterium sp.]MDW8195891.1 zinc ABC transporter substrate-binding protein [Candidatus Calescibacterium sp.]
MNTVKYIKIITFLFLFFLGTVFSKEIITFSINPLLGFYYEIVGHENKNKWKYNVLIDSSFDHHHFDIKPSKFKMIKDSKALFLIGTLELDREVLKITNIKDKIILSNYLEIYNSDPHIWISVKNCKKIIQIMYNYLYSNQKINRNELYQNYSKLYRRYDDLDKRLHSSFKQKRIIIFSYHNEFGYISRDYGVNIIPLFKNEEDISPRYLQDLIRRIRSYKQNVHIILPVYYDKKVINYIKKELNNINFTIFNSNSINIYEEFVKLESLR